jgi:hypothetical protein
VKNWGFALFIMSSTGKEKELAGTEMLRRKSARTHTRQERDGSKAKPIVISESPQPKPGYSPKDTIASRDDRNTSSVTTLSATLPSQLPGLSKKGVQLLRSKQELLKSPQSQINNLSDFCDPKLSGFQALREAVDATLVFAQEEAV